MSANVKEKAKEARNGLQQGIYMVINPFVRLLIRMGVTPNMVTTIGFLGNAAAAAVLVWAGIRFSSEGIVDWSLLIWAGALIIGFSLFDMLYGHVARLGNMASSFGAMYDSVLDSYCEMLTLGGISFFLFCCNSIIGVIVTFLAMVGSIMVSYTRARAEGLGVECKIGFMQRPERVVVTALSTLAAGIVGVNINPLSDFDPNCILICAMAIIAIFANLTTFARLGHAKRQLIAKDRENR